MAIGGWGVLVAVEGVVFYLLALMRLRSTWFWQWCDGWVSGAGKHYGCFFFWFGLGEQIWWWEFVGVGGCLCLDKFGVGLKGSDALIRSQCSTQ